jgi:TorA maturation chaperone TorD
MRDQGLEHVIQTVGGIRGLSRLLGISQPAVSNWKRVPADRILQVESVTGVSRSVIRPDLYGTAPMDENALDPIEQARADEYALLGLLLWRAPSADLLGGLARLKGDASPLGMAHLELGLAAAGAKVPEIEAEFFQLFIGLGRGELLPYASYYLTGFLHERPLAKVREDLAELGIERAERAHEPEDHIAMLCEVMSGIISGQFTSENIDHRVFFDRHLKPWANRFFTDLGAASSTDFYRAVGALGRVFIEIETEAAGFLADANNSDGRI